MLKFTNKNPPRLKFNQIVIEKYSTELILCNGVDANKEQVKTGMAWVYVKYAKDQDLFDLELIARKNKIGLWIDKDPVAPWLFRRAGGH